MSWEVVAPTAAKHDSVADAPVAIVPDRVTGSRRGRAVETWPVGDSCPADVSVILGRIVSGEDGYGGRSP